jgi:spermidine synthase
LATVFNISDPARAPHTIERLDGPHGELVLRRVDGHYEIISNGTFLMDTRNGESERLLVTAALAGATTAAQVLIGGLGVGFSLLAALAHPRTRRVTVVEQLATVIDWHRGPLREVSQSAVDDPRTELVCADLVSWLADTDRRFDAICLDIDNGPDWTVVPDNDRLYSEQGVQNLARRLTPGGTVTIWSAADSPRFTQLLHRCFADVELMEIAVPLGDPDVVFVARRPKPV